MGKVLVHHGNASEQGGFKHFRAGHELATPAFMPDGTRIFRTPTGRTFKTKKM